jgi:CHASE3 domain sensor protein
VEELKQGVSKSQLDSTSVSEKAIIDEDEINLIDYFRVLWKRKSLILLGSILPALIFGVILFLWPKMYKVTYTYDVKDQSFYDVKDQSLYDLREPSYNVRNWNLDEKNYNVLLNRFYSTENINKIVSKLREKSLDRYAELIGRAGDRKDSKKFVDFEVLPPYIDISKAKITEAANLEQFRQLKALLLNMTIVARPKNDVGVIASVVRDNFENIIPVYLVAEHLKADTRKCRAEMADIEENKFDKELTLKANKEALTKLKNVKTVVSDESESRIALQFDISGKTEYLPIKYQVQATESRIVDIEREISTNEAKYNHYRDLSALNEKLLAELKNNTSSYYTIQQFHSFLTGLISSYEGKTLKDYLNSYIKKIENRISASAPVTEKPKVYAVSKGTAKKTAIVFAVCLMISVFAAFLSEGLQKSQTQAL